MSQTKAQLIAGTSSQDVIFDDATVNSLNGGPLAGTRNRIINGDMRIDQRNAGAAVTINNAANTYVVDRWRANANGGGAFSLQRSTVAPAGFTNSLLATVTTADASVVSGDFYHVRQTIEGFNCSDLGFGSAAAQTITLSFWTRNSLTGTFTVLLRNNDGSRGYVTTYTVNAANTWEYKTITIPGDTTGTWATDNSGSCIVNFGLGHGVTQTPNVWTTTSNEAVTGMTQWISTNGATFYITGVQLEPGTVATPFERRSFGQELALCQRYYEKSYELGTTPGSSATPGSHWFTSLGATANVFSSLSFSAEKRASPTVNVWDTAGNANKASWGDSSGTIATNNTQTVIVQFVGDSGITLRQSNGISGAVAVGYHWNASAEL